VKSSRFTLLVFDWDGTLADSQAQIVRSFQSAIHDLDFEPRTYQQISQIIGLGLIEGIATLFPHRSDTDLKKLAACYNYHFYRADRLPVSLFPDVAKLLEQLHAMGYWLAVATGKSRQGLNQALTDTQLMPLFLCTRCADETISKPHPRMLQEIMTELGKTSQETLMIGDSIYDLQMANNAQVASVAVSYGVHDKNSLLNCQPLVCLDTLTQLPAWLENT
jgi:phosphoglycolate phosphatase